MLAQTTQVSSLTPDQFAELIEQRSYQGTLRALADYQPPKEPDLPPYPTRKQARDFLQTSYVTLNDWAKDKPDRSAILVPVKMGSCIRYNREDVLKVFRTYRRFQNQ